MINQQNMSWIVTIHFTEADITDNFGIHIAKLSGYPPPVSSRLGVVIYLTFAKFAFSHSVEVVRTIFP